MIPREITWPCEHSRRDAERARLIAESLDMALLDRLEAAAPVTEAVVRLPARTGSTEAAVTLLRTAEIVKGDA